ncbi:MAG: hypothetical protein IKS55_12645 [Oscillospiraceae bacterium]|nr:hypothetical protein [Oscillospiraceae bacterium]
MPAEYNVVLDTYYSILCGDWYAALSAEDLWNMGACPLLAEFSSEEKQNFGYYLEDINGDGSPELFLGIDNEEYNDQMYQLFTAFGGQLSCLYTATGENAAYLLNNGLLEYETWGLDNNGYAMCVYRFDGSGNVYVTEGVLYDENAGKGPYFSVTDDSFNAAAGKPISENQFYQKLDSVALKEKYVRYQPISGWNGSGNASSGSGGQQSTGSGSGKTASSAPQVNTGSASSLYYTHETLKDNASGVKIANVLVPYGWNMSFKVSWDFISTSTPGVADVILTSPDGKARINLTSDMQFLDMYANGMHYGEGADMSIYCTRLHFRDAEEVQSLFLQGGSYSNAQLVKSYTVPDSLVQTLKEGARLRLQKNVADTGGTPIASEGSAAQKLYKSGNQYIEYLTLVTAAMQKDDTGHVVLTEIMWNIPYSCSFIADSKQSYDQYRDVFLNVVANSCFTAEFNYVNMRYGTAIANAISSHLLEQSMQYIQSGTSSWASEYEHSSGGYDSDRFTSEWSDVIKEQNEYTTLDGETIKVSTSYDTVYQDGDRFYMGPDGQSPYGWTRLYPN